MTLDRTNLMGSDEEKGPMVTKTIRGQLRHQETS